MYFIIIHLVLIREIDITNFLTIIHLDYIIRVFRQCKSIFHKKMVVVMVTIRNEYLAVFLVWIKCANLITASPLIIPSLNLSMNTVTLTEWVNCFSQMRT